MSKFLDSIGLTYLWMKAKAAFAALTHTHTVSDISDLIGQGIPFIMGTQTATTASWTGAASFLATPADLVSGTSILYYLPRTSATNATLNLTCANGTQTGAKNLYYNGSTRLGTQYAAGNVLRLTYLSGVAINGSGSYTGWWAEANYDTNNYDRLRYQQAIKAGDTAIVAANIIVPKAETDGTFTYTHLKLGRAFDTRYPILYSAAALAVGATGTNNYLMYPLTITTTQAASTATTSWGKAITAQKAVYIKGTMSGTTFTPISTTPLRLEISDDGYQYMLLGVTYSATAMYLLPNHNIYEYKNGSIREWQPAISASEIADLPSVPTKTSQLTNDSGFLTEHQSLSGYVPTSRTINDKALSSNITLSASDVGAAAAQHTHEQADITDLDAITSAELSAVVSALPAVEESDLEDVCVTGVKGNAESSYRQGKVNITPSNIGLGNLANLRQVTLTETQSISGAKTFTNGINVQGNDFILRSSTGTGTTTPDGEYGIMVVESDSGKYFRLYQAAKSGKNASIQFNVGGSSDNGQGSAKAFLEIIHDRTNNSGLVNISPKLSLLGSGTYTGTWAKSSDERLKENFTDIDTDKVSEFIDNTRTKEFNFIGNEQREIGVIAQDVQKYFPQAVVENTDGYLAVDYSTLVVPLMVCVRELRKEVAELKAEIESIKTELENK